MHFFSAVATNTIVFANSNPCSSRFVAWPQEALKSVARHFLDAVDMEEAVKAGVVDVCVDMQQRARDMAERYRSEMGRFYYVTPTSYLELINTFKVNNQEQATVGAARGTPGAEKDTTCRIFETYDIYCTCIK